MVKSTRREPPAPVEPAGPGEKNVWVSSETHRRLKVAAAARGLPLKKFAEDLLEWALEEAERAEKKGGR